MSCANIREQLPGYLDGALPGRAHGPVREHLESCQDCRTELEQYRKLQVLMSRAGRPAPPADLAVRIRVAVAQAKETQGWAAHLRRAATRAHLVLENILEPLAVPATGGVLSAVLMFVCVMQVFAAGVPYGEIVNDLPTNLLQPARLEQLASFPVPGALDFGEAGIASAGALMVEATVNAQGQLVSYEIISGPDNASIRRQLDRVLMFSRFRPLMSFGRPTSGGRVVLSFSEVRVKG
jgi:hypothetical protein